MNGIVLHTRFEPSSAAILFRLRPGLPPRELRLKSLAAATALALALLPDASFGQSIGPLDVRSSLGERFFGAVPVSTPDGILDPGCIRVVPNPNAPAGAQPLQGVRIRTGSADTVIIETVGTVTSPVGLRLQVGCENPVSRDFIVLDASASQPETMPSVPATASVSTPAAPIARRAAATEPRPQPPRRAVAPTRTVKSPAADAGTSTLRGAGAAPAARSTAPARSATGAAATPASAVAAAAAPSGAAARPAAPEPQRRIADLRARSDDHAAALLALEDRLALLQKQAELLKAQLEQRLAAAPDRSNTAPEAPATHASATVASAAAPAAATPGASAATPTRSSAIQPAAAAPPAPSRAAAAVSSAPAVTPANGSPRSQSVLDLLLDWKVAGGIAVLLLGAAAISRRRRPTFQPAPAKTARADTSADTVFEETPAHLRTQEVPVLAQAVRPADTTEWETTHPRMVDQTAEWVPPPTTDSLPLPGTATSQHATLPGAAMTREFHLTQQFEPAAERVVALSSPEEIVQQARTHYMEDNDIFKAIDLLEMAVAARKDSTRPWQALFAIYRRENMPERYQRLVLAYRSAFGQDDNWVAIRTLGQQIDASNPLYGEADGSETIPDDLVERWLGVPLDFTAHLLASEMHDQLMATYSGRQRRKSR